jgi:exosortase
MADGAESTCSWRRWLPVAAFAAAAAAALYGFSGMFQRTYVLYAFAHEEDMSFGWFVPVFSLYVLWTRRERLVEAMGLKGGASAGFSVLGFLACWPLAALALLGTRGQQLRLEMLGFIGLCVALPWTFFGWRCAKRFLFPAAYLLFCIPMATFLDFVTIHLRYFAGAVSLGVLNGIGLEAVREGTAVISRGAHPFAVDIAEPCSGLRSLFALMAVTAGYAYLNQPNWLRRALLFACSVPLAIAGNVARVVSICVIASATDAEFATGFYHDYSGYIVFLVAIGLMVVAGEAIDRIFGRRAAAGALAGCAADVHAASEKVLFGCAFRVFAAVTLAAVFMFKAHTPRATVAKAPDVAFFDIAGYATDDRKNADVQAVSEGERTVLPKDTAIYKKLYESRGGASFLVSFVVGGASRASIHRPELCLPSQGYVMSNPRNFDAAGVPWHAIDVCRPGGTPSVKAYTFFNQTGFRTASHTARIWRDVVDRSVFNRVDRWVMVTVSAFGATEAEMREFLGLLAAGWRGIGGKDGNL